MMPRTIQYKIDGAATNYLEQYLLNLEVTSCQAPNITSLKQ